MCFNISMSRTRLEAFSLGREQVYSVLGDGIYEVMNWTGMKEMHYVGGNVPLQNIIPEINLCNLSHLTV